MTPPFAHVEAVPTGRHSDRRRGRGSGSNLRFTVPRPGTNDTPVNVRHPETDALMVRLRREVTHTKGLYQGSQIVMVRDVHLDGTLRVNAYTADRKHHIQSDEDLMPSEQTIRAARTKDTIDFGRFQQACVALLAQVDEARKYPDDEDRQEAVFRSYQGIIAWREALRQQVSDVDSAIDVVAAKIRAMVQ